MRMFSYGLMALGLIAALSACAMDDGALGDDESATGADPASDSVGDGAEPRIVDLSRTEEIEAVPAEVFEDPEADGFCAYVDNYSWGCHGDSWCEDLCQVRDYAYGWTSFCDWRVNHMETTCTCCG